MLNRLVFTSFYLLLGEQLTHVQMLVGTAKLTMIHCIVD